MHYIHTARPVHSSIHSLLLSLSLCCGLRAAERLEYIGPYPNVICDVAVLGFQDGMLIFLPLCLPLCLCLLLSGFYSDCRLPQKDQFTQAANFMCFGVLFSAVASAAGTFGNEQVSQH